MTLRFTLALLAALSLGGCGGVATAPEPAFHALDAAPCASPAPVPWVDGVVLVRPPVAEGVVRERAVVYQEGPDDPALRQHHYHFWAEPPSRLVQSRTLACLRARAVAPLVTDDASVEADVQVSGRLAHWERVRREDGYRVRVELELQVRRQRSPRPEWLQTYALELPVGESTVAASVPVFARALDEILDRFVLDAARALRAGAGSVGEEAGP